MTTEKGELPVHKEGQAIEAPKEAPFGVSGEGEVEKLFEPEVMEKVLKELPPEARRVVKAWRMEQFSGPVPPQVLNKITSEHITKSMELAARGDERSFQTEQSARRYNLVYVLLAAALFVFLTCFLVPNNPAMYQEALKYIVLFGGGFGVGYGLKKE